MAEVAGEGAYGCVHKPQLLCRGETVRKPNKISKLLTTLHAKKELGEYDTIDSIDKSKQYYLGKPTECYPDAKLQNMKDINKCRVIGPAVLRSFADPSTMDDYSLLIMKDGGVDLDQFANSLHALPVNEDNIEKVEKFWLEAYRILLGLKTFLDNDVVHHDLKHPNIVYNEKTNRMNFIDFGLMTKKSTIMRQCKENRYGFGQFHWSFPWELYYLNRPQYLNIAAANGQVKISKIQTMIDLIKMGPGANRFSSAVATFLYIILDPNLSKDKQEREMQSKLHDYSVFLKNMKPEMEEYEKILEKSVSTIDSYGVGMAFLNVLHRCKRFLSRTMYISLARLFDGMVYPDPNVRTTVDKAIADYRDIMEDGGLLTKQKKRFDVDGQLVDDVPLPPRIEKAIEDIGVSDIRIPPRELGVYMVSPIRQCPDDKEYNPFTKRCVKKCKAGDERDAATFKCKKTKQQRPAKRSVTVKQCPAGKERNPKTGRCVKECKAGQVRDADFKCVKQ